MNDMKNKYITLFCLILCTLVGFTTPTQSQEKASIRISGNGERAMLNTGWYARRANEIKTDGNQLSLSAFNSDGWMKATVPGTVLTTLLDNNLFPAPEFGMNNELIPDIHDTITVLLKSRRVL